MTVRRQFARVAVCLLALSAFLSAASSCKRRVASISADPNSDARSPNTPTRFAVSTKKDCAACLAACTNAIAVAAEGHLLHFRRTATGWSTTTIQLAAFDDVECADGYVAASTAGTDGQVSYTLQRIVTGDTYVHRLRGPVLSDCGVVTTDCVAHECEVSLWDGLKKRSFPPVAMRGAVSVTGRAVWLSGIDNVSRLDLVTGLVSTIPVIGIDVVVYHENDDQIVATSGSPGGVRSLVVVSKSSHEATMVASRLPDGALVRASSTLVMLQSKEFGDRVYLWHRSDRRWDVFRRPSDVVDIDLAGGDLVVLRSTEVAVGSPASLGAVRTDRLPD